MRFVWTMNFYETEKLFPGKLTPCPLINRFVYVKNGNIRGAPTQLRTWHRHYGPMRSTTLTTKKTIQMENFDAVDGSHESFRCLRRRILRIPKQPRTSTCWRRIHKRMIRCVHRSVHLLRVSVDLCDASSNELTHTRITQLIKWRYNLSRQYWMDS